MTTTGMQPLMVVDRDDAIFTGLGSATGFRRVINRIDEVSDHTTEKGTLFEVERLFQGLPTQDTRDPENRSPAQSWPATGHIRPPGTP